MKTSCPSCGCHFGDEFDQTLKPGCDYWQACGGSGLSDESKKIVWDWIFAMPADYLSIKEQISLGCAISFNPIMPGVEFKQIVPGWDKMREEDRRKFQREYQKDPELIANLVRITKSSEVKN